MSFKNNSVVHFHAVLDAENAAGNTAIPRITLNSISLVQEDMLYLDIDERSDNAGTVRMLISAFDDEYQYTRKHVLSGSVIAISEMHKCSSVSLEALMNDPIAFISSSLRNAADTSKTLSA